MFNFALKFLVRMCFSRRLKGNQEKYDFGSTEYEARSFTSYFKLLPSNFIKPELFPQL